MSIKRGSVLSHYGHKQLPDECCFNFLKSVLFFVSWCQAFYCLYQLVCIISLPPEDAYRSILIVIYLISVIVTITQLYGVVREVYSIVLSSTIVNVIYFISLLYVGDGTAAIIDLLITICCVWFTVLLKKRIAVHEV